MTSPLGKYLDREAVLAALDQTECECHKAYMASRGDPYLLGYTDGVGRAREIVGSQPTVRPEANCEGRAQ